MNIQNIDIHMHQSNHQLIAHHELNWHHQIKNLVEAPAPITIKLKRVPGILQAFIPFDYLRICLPISQHNFNGTYNYIRTGFEEYQMMTHAELQKTTGLPANESIAGAPESTTTTAKEGLTNGTDYKLSLVDDRWERHLSAFYRLESKIVKSFSVTAHEYATISFYTRKYDGYSGWHMQLLEKITPELRRLMGQILCEESMPPYLPEMRKVLKKDSVKKNTETDRFHGIVGRSPLFLQVLDQISIVAPSDISVLITGKSGTGKEKIARRLHELSPRKLKPMIIINCGAMPNELIESELFGHEKGSFTGATEKRIGKFEAADGGSIFLDEVGELSLTAQVKLLRVLQEMEFERVGSCKTVKVDVRVISATNKNLEEEVANGRFRLDLYYRLNIFPIDLPSLLQRKTDIPLLADRFIQRFATKHGKDITGLSPEALKTLQNYSWPGNIRELEHVMERTILMAKGSSIDEVILPKGLWKSFEPDTIDTTIRPKTLEENEVEHIIKILKICGGRVAGPGGAAEILDLPSSTLQSKIKKFGIRKEFDR